VLFKLGQLTQLRQQLSEHERGLAELATQLESCRKQGEAFQQLQTEWELKQHRLDLLNAEMRSSQSHQLAGSVEALKLQQTEQLAAAEAANLALAEARAHRDHLAAQVSDFEGNREERMAQAKRNIGTAEKEAKATAKSLQTAQQKEQVLAQQAVEFAKELTTMEEQHGEIKARLVDKEKALQEKAASEQAQKCEYDAATASLQACTEELGSYDAEVSELQAERDAAEKQKSGSELELKQIELRVARAHKEMSVAETCCAELLKRHPWMVNEQQHFGKPGGEYEFTKKKTTEAAQMLAKQTSSLETLGKRINKKVLSMFETAEQEYADLMSKKEIVEKDKAKIEAVIAELGQKKIEALRKTWTKVNKDFGSIFSTLLPGANAKLEPQEGCPVEEGLIVKVGFGQVWKQSLLELSGGQRSLIALSLVLSLLRFKPAPVYILDEIDAALDLSHTQNIGAMIRTHFKQSQFLVVSLKEGMFNNANVLFRTKFVDGVSTITRTVPAGAATREMQADAKKKNNADASRKALVALN